MNSEFDFDKIIDRAGTDSLKWNHYSDPDVIPMWVADMDFAIPPAIQGALKQRINHGVFGYSIPTPQLTQVVVDYIRDNFDWTIQPNWIVWLPGLVTGINIACRAYAEKGDEIVTFTPAYPPFLDAPPLADQRLVSVPLIHISGKYTIDFDALRKSITQRTRLLLLCNPHNPTGRIFTRAELKQLTDICIEHNILICSDEIHNGLLLDDLPHISTATLSTEVADRTITLMAPSKTFNVPGLSCAFAIIPNPSLRKQFYRTKADIVPYVGTLGYTACLAAFRDSGKWHKALLEYLKNNRDIVYRCINDDIPLIASDRVEATYLAWIDCRELPVDDPAKFFEKAGVGLSDSKDFGCEGFVRLNFACPTQTLQKALNRMKRAVNQLL